MRGWLGAALAAATMVAVAGTVAAAESPEESWFRLTIGGAHVGYTHRIVEPAPDGGTVTRVESAMVVMRLGDELRLTSAEEWTESADGRPVSYRLTRDMGMEETELSVRVGAGRLAIEKLAAGGVFVDTLAVGERLLFPEGQRRLHASEGFAPGDTYTYIVFDPDFEDVSRHDVSVLGRDSLVIMGSRLGLQKVVVLSGLYEGVKFLVWLDDEGRVWREEAPALGLAQERCSEEAAVGIGPVVDIIVETMIETNEVIPVPRAVDGALYEIWIEGEDISPLLPTDLRQAVEGRTDRGVLLRVRRVVPDTGMSPGDSPPGGDLSEYLEGNALLQVEDPRLRAASAEAVGGESLEPWPSAQRIERRVFDTMESVGFGSAFASALEVLQHPTGDCSEHAVLAAAMSRAVGIPSRVVSGLVHTRGRFAYHMWIEVWTGGDWYALDPTIGSGSVDATHIKLADSSLAGGRVGDLSLAIMRAMNRLRIDIVEYVAEGKVVRARTDR